MDETITRSLFVGLVGDELQDVLDAFESRSFQAGDTIVKMGDEGDELFLIVAGKVRVWTGDGPASNERTLSVMGPGEHFGEASMISGKPRSATVSALTYLETLVLRREGYQRLLPKHPELLHNISRSLTRRLSNMNAYANEKHKAKRGIHSLAILVGVPEAWGLGTAMLNQLRQQGKAVHPLVVSDEELPFDIRKIDRDAQRVPLSELARSVATHTGNNSLAVAMVSGSQSMAAAVKECDRVIATVSDDKHYTQSLRQYVDPIPAHRRPIVAVVHPGDTDDPSPCLPIGESIRALRVKFTPGSEEKRHDPELDPASVTRLARQLSGIRIGLALGGGGARARRRASGFCEARHRV
jgi:CRP-like cAMP-binding protein